MQLYNINRRQRTAHEPLSACIPIFTLGPAGLTVIFDEEKFINIIRFSFDGWCLAICHVILYATINKNAIIILRLI